MNPINDEMLSLKKEKVEMKRKWPNKFLSELELVIEKCFLKNKTKKEQFITQEKIEIELIKLLQTQKKFCDTEKKFDTATLAVFDTEDSLMGKIKTIDLEKKEISFLNICGQTKTKNLNLVRFFDVYSLEMQVFYEKQRKVHDSYYYKDTFSFLTYEKPKEEPKMAQRYGTLEERTKLTMHIDYNK